MVELQIDIKAQRARKTLKTLFKRINNLEPIWKDFKKYYQDDIIPRSWNSKGALMEGGRWTPLTPAYWKWKLKSGLSKKLLTLIGKMFTAAKGGAGWYDKIDKKSMTMGIQGEKYYYWVQHRQTNPRFYFYTKKEDIPNRAYAYLIKITDEYLEDADDDR